MNLVNSGYSIRAVASATGLSTHTIRSWEKRYGVISPRRTGTNRRAYSEEDVERLKLLRRAVSAGHSIGMVSSLPKEELAAMVLAASDLETGVEHLACLDALDRLDGSALEMELKRSVAALGADAWLANVVAPLLRQLGTGWAEGSHTIAQEHLATSLIRTELDRLRLSINPTHSPNRLLVSTPQGQVHELGALMAATWAARLGWNTTYLGASIPAKEIAMAIRSTGSHALALSLIYPEGDPQVAQELVLLRSSLPRLPILVGGAAAFSYRMTLLSIDANPIENLADLGRKLEDLGNSLPN